MHGASFTTDDKKQQKNRSKVYLFLIYTFFMKKSFTAEFVSEKHPDKMCDRISDAILQKFIDQDPNSRVAVETMGGHGKIFIMGEVTSSGNISDKEYEEIVSEITGENLYEIAVHIAQQSPEIAQGVDYGGAGDQGIVIGYACNHNKEFLPQEFYLAKSLNNFLYNIYPYDGNTQITIDENFFVTHIVASFQNSKIIDLKKLVQNWIQKEKVLVSNEVVYKINPAGEWSVGGFEADTGLTGRKIVVDSYGPRVPVGGGAFSGKDWTKVDRSGAEYAKFISQELLKKHQAKEVKVELAYAIGVADSIQSIAYIDGIAHCLNDFDTSMSGINNFLNQRNS